MALRTSKLSKNCASRGLVGPFRRAARAPKRALLASRGGGGAAAPPPPPLGYVPALRMLNIAAGYSKNTLPCSELSEEHAGEGFRSLRHIRRYERVKQKKCHFSRKFDL